MKKLFVLAAVLLSFEAFAQSPVAGILNRFTDPEKGKVVFIEKGSRAIGIRGGYRNISVDGYTAGDGYAILAMLNVGGGSLHLWNVAPKFSWFVADDLSLGVNLTYNGYWVETDINLDFREIIPQLYTIDEVKDIANVTISSRHMEHHAWGVAFSARKYLSFFGSRTFGVFAEGRLFAKYGQNYSYPRVDSGYGRTTLTRTGQAGVQFAVGGAVRLRDNSAITVSLPIFGVAWNGSWQNLTRAYPTNPTVDGQGNKTYETAYAHGGGRLSTINASRAVDFMGLQIGYTRYIQPKKKH